MHETALCAGWGISKLYGSPNKVVVDIGGFNMNGSLRNYFTEAGMKFICVDIAEHPSVDVVIKPGDKLPFETGSVDIVVSTSCFEHDPCFWLTFKEMARIVKLDGIIYINAPTYGAYHRAPGDNWRFYSDAGQALAYWSGIQMGNEEIYPVKVLETFHILPNNDIWTDFVCVWQRVNEKDTAITISPEIRNKYGQLEHTININGYKTSKDITTQKS